MPLGLALLAGGALFLIAGIKGVHPWAPIVDAFGGVAPDPPGTKGAEANAATIAEMVAGNQQIDHPRQVPKGVPVGGGGFPSSYLPANAPRGVGPNPVGAAVVSKARSYIGSPYANGGTTRAGIDCSGLSLVSYASVGVKLPHLASAQLPLCRVLQPSEVTPGDLIFFFSLDMDPHDPIFHVAVFSGNGKMIEATSIRRPCSEDPVTLQQFAKVYARPHAVIGLGGRGGAVVM